MKFTIIASCTAAAVVLGGVARPSAKGPPPSIDSQVVFLYYTDVDEAAAFYETTLGLRKTFDEGWVRIYEIGETSSVGVVDEARGFHKVSDNKPVMLSMATREVDAWYEYLGAAGVTIISELSDSENAPIRAFVVEDPGGYTVEFFEWR